MQRTEYTVLYPAKLTKWNFGRSPAEIAFDCQVACNAHAVTFENVNFELTNSTS